MGSISSCHSNCQTNEFALQSMDGLEAGDNPQIEAEASMPVNDSAISPLLATVQAHGEEINCLAISKDASLIASGSEDCSVRVWSTEQWDCIRELLGHSDYITCLVFAGTHLLSGSSDTTVRMWNLFKGECIFTIAGHMGFITSICATQTQIFTSGNDHQVRSWSFDDGRLIREYNDHKGAVYGIRISSGGEELGQESSSEASSGRRRVRFVTFSADCTARLWSATRSTSLQTFSGHSGPVTCVALDEKRHLLYTGSSDGRIASWLVETGQNIHWFEGHSAPIIDLLISDDCLYSASSDETARVWVTDIAQELQVFKRHGHTVFKLGLLLKGDLLITGSGDGEIRCFDTKTAIIIERFICPKQGKFCCFELVGNVLVAASQEGQLCVWDLSTMIDKAKSKEEGQSK